MSATLDALLLRYAEAREVEGRTLTAEQLAGDDPSLLASLRAAIERYERVAGTLEFAADSARVEPSPGAAPAIPGFRVIERLGAGGMGEVWKLEDERLGRKVAAKVLHGEGVARAYGDFLSEARALALFDDPRIVKIHDLYLDGAEPALLMEYVEGFELGEVGPSLAIRDRARVVAELAGALARAHELGLVHRDVKPANVVLDASLSPKLLDFGLAGTDPAAGHGVGTLPYLAPEQLDPERPIDPRTDVYALGVVLYELLTGERPYGGESLEEVLAALDRAAPKLPTEVDPAVPEPLQAIALKAMEARPEDRYASASAMEEELRRWLDGRPVLARPTLYASALSRRLGRHLDEVREWLAGKLIYPHEAERVLAAYRGLEAREDDWIVESRRLTPAGVVLYLGAFLLFSGALFYFVAHRFHEAASGLAGPFAALALPFAALLAAALWLERHERRALAVALHLGGAVLLPLFLLIVFAELGWWEGGDAFFGEGTISNRQLQIASLAACGWNLWLALRTRTTGLGVLFVGSALFAWLSILTDLGLEDWLADGRWDLLALHLLPLAALAWGSGLFEERRGRSFLAVPGVFGGVFLALIAAELLALDGRALAYLGISFSALAPLEPSIPHLLETVAAMTFFGLAAYALAAVAERAHSRVARQVASLVLVLAPFLMLEPLAYLNAQGEYPEPWLWVYLVLSLLVAAISWRRQRRSFFYAGLANTGSALLLIADRYEWFDAPLWALAVLGAGLGALMAGALLDGRERRQRSR